MPFVHDIPQAGDRRGVSAELMPWSETQVLKLFWPGFPRDVVECEFLNAQAASNLGVPTPRPERIVKVDSRFGIVFERCRGIPLYDALVSGSESADQLAGMFFALQRAIHAHPCGSFPRLTARLREKVGRAAGISSEVRNHALRIIDTAQSAPALCHGDFHPLNVLLTPAGAVAIDWLDACQGDPAADMARALLVIEFARPRAEDATRRAAFLEAYRRRCETVLARDTLDAWRLPVVLARLSEPVEAHERQSLLWLVHNLVAAVG